MCDCGPVRNQGRAIVLVFLSLLTAMAMGIASALMGAVALGATALIVPGTGTPKPNEVDQYLGNAWSRYIDGVACIENCADPDLVGIDYPASFWPLTFIPGWCVPSRCAKWDVSVGEGATNLITQLTPFLDEGSDEDVYIFGYSQGGAVVANTLEYLKGLDLDPGVKERLEVVTIGGIENPDGGFWQRLAWLRYLLGEPVPIIDVSFEPGMAVDTGIKTTSIGFEYDPVVYAPRYWGNALAVLNMIAAFDTVHGYYLSPNGNDENAVLPYGYTPASPTGPGTLAPQLNCGLNPTNCREDSYGNTYIMIPATSLPLTDLVRSLADSMGIGRLAKPFIDLVEPVLKVMVDLGFDWSGDPGVSRSLSPLPFKIFQNWIKVGVDLAVATVKGIEAFFGNFDTGSAATQLLTPERRELAPLSVAADSTAAGESEDAHRSLPLELTVGEEQPAEADPSTVDQVVPGEGNDAGVEDVVEDDVVDEGLVDEDVVDEDVVTEDVTQDEDVAQDNATQDDAPQDEDVTADADTTDTTDTTENDATNTDTRDTQAAA